MLEENKEIKENQEVYTYVPSEPVFVPAKPGEQAPAGVWVPPRAYRRAMKKKKVKYTNLLTGKDVMANEDFANGLYKDLLENLKKKVEKMKENEEENGDAIEGNEDL